MNEYKIVTVYYQVHTVQAKWEEEAFLKADDTELEQVLQPSFIEDLGLVRVDRLTVEESQHALSNLGATV